jgi:hypothetical protein
LYVGNDVGELRMHVEDFGGLGPRFQIASLEAADGRWRIEPPGASGGRLARWDWLLQTRLRLHAMLHRVVAPAAQPAGSALARVAGACPGCLQSLWQASVANGDPAALADAFSRLDDVLARFQVESTAARIPLLVVVIPTKLQVESAAVRPEVEEAAALLGLHYDAVAFDDAIGTRIIAAAQARGMTTIDLLPALHAAYARDGQPLYRGLDWHLNAAGNAVIARELTPVVAGLLGAG